MTTLLAEEQQQQAKTENNISNENIQDMGESAESQDNNAIGKKYTTTRMKLRNFLSNIAYVGINKEDYYNKNFILDVYSLNRKLAYKTKHEMIYMLWKECMPTEFYKHICLEKNFVYLNGKNVLQPKVLQIISEFIEADDNNYRLLQNNLSSCKIIFQYVYSNIFPKIYCSTEKERFRH